MIPRTALTQVRKWRVLNSVLQVFSSDVEGSDTKFCRRCKLQANDYQYVSDNSSDSINSVNLTPAQKYKHSQQLLTIPEMMEFCFCRNCATFASDFQISCIAHMKEYSGMVGRYHHSFIYFV